MPTRSVRLFGKFGIECATRVTPDLTSRKAQELFCYLLLYRDRPHPRETLATVLWGDTSTAQSKTYLRKTLWQLQTALEPPAERGQPRTFLVTSEWVQLNPQADLWLDVAVFEQVSNSVQGMPGTQLDSCTAASLQHAVALYRGDLLDGWYHDWCLYERERLQTMYLGLLDKLMDYCERQHAYEGGLAYGTQILRYDRAREQTHRRMMWLYALSGDRTAARRQFERCAAALEDELGVNPDPCTTRLYEQIMTNQVVSEPSPLDYAAVEPVTKAPLTDVLGRLKRLQSALAEFQQRIQHDIREVEQTLQDQTAGSALGRKKNALGYVTETLQDTSPQYVFVSEAITNPADLRVGRPYAEPGSGQMR